MCKKLSGTRGLRYLRYGYNLCPRGAHTHVTSLLQTLNWLPSDSGMSPGHSRPHNTSPCAHFSSDTSLIAVSWTQQAHFPVILQLLFLPRVFFLLLSVFIQKSPSQGTFPGSLTKNPTPRLPSHISLLALLFVLWVYHFLNSYQPYLFSISHTRKWAPQRQRFLSVLLTTAFSKPTTQ